MEFLVKWDDGSVVRGATFEQVVDMLVRLETAFSGEADLTHADYMRRVAGRLQISDRLEIRIDTAENFVTDLLAAQILVEYIPSRGADHAKADDQE